MKRQSAETLARSRDLGDRRATDYYKHIVDSLINGQRSQVRELFNEMNGASQRLFLKTYLDIKSGAGNGGYDKSVLNICIDELTKDN